MIFSSWRFFQKTNKRIWLYYHHTYSRLVFVHFLEEIEDTKKTFRNQLTFSRQFEKEVNTAVLAFSLAFITTGAITDSIFLEKLPVKTFFLLIFLWKYCLYFLFQKFVDITQQCFVLLPQVNFPANNLNFHWRWK